MIVFNLSSDVLNIPVFFLNVSQILFYLFCHLLGWRKYILNTLQENQSITYLMYNITYYLGFIVFQNSDELGNFYKYILNNIRLLLIIPLWLGIKIVS